MRIVFNTWRSLAHPLAGGSEHYVDILARGLLDIGHQVTMFAGGPPDSSPYPVVSTGGTYDHYLRTPLHHRRRARDSDVVVDVVSGMAYFTPLWRRKPVVLIVHHVHLEQWGMMFPRPVAAMGRVLEGRLMPRVYGRSLTVAPSRSTEENLADLGFRPENIRRVPVPIEVPVSSGSKSPTPLFVAVGRLVPYKRIDLLLDVWRNVQRETGGELVLVGDGPERAALEARLPANTRLAGFVDEEEKIDLLTRAWVLLHPAAHEGWGLVITEAGARGTPTVGFDVPGVRDAVVDGRTGVLARTDADFSRAWTELARDARRRRHLGQEAMEVARRHEPESSVEAFEAILREAVARGRTAASR